VFARSAENYLLLLEHPHTYTLGRNAERSNMLVDAAGVGAVLVESDRGGDVTYHGPGQLVGYPILTIADHAAGQMASTREYVGELQDMLIEVLTALGCSNVGVLCDAPGVWVDANGPRPRKIAAIGVRISRGRTLHGFALNVSPDLSMFSNIVPCGISDKGVTSLAAEGIDVTLAEVVERVMRTAAARWTAGEKAPGENPSGEKPPGEKPPGSTTAAVVFRQAMDGSDLSPFSRGAGAGEAIRYQTAGRQHDGTSLRLSGRLAEAGVATAVPLAEPKPEWMRARVRLGTEVLGIQHRLRSLDLVTVCEEAGCPNRSECWADGTATFMVCGERCTRACGFCLIDTAKPAPLDSNEPERVAEAVEQMGLRYAVVTMVARDDLDDGGAGHVAATIAAIRARMPQTQVEVLISDLRGSGAALATVLAAEPDVVNHNLETVARLQRAVRPSAGYARSLAVLARSAAAGRVVKSGLVVGMGETFDEVVEALRDLAAVGTQIVTIGQYLRPTSHHLPVAQWWTPQDFAQWKAIGESEFGLAHVESSPLTRSSYHAAAAADSAVLHHEDHSEV
jgi:lipoic acid synthetase